MIRSLLYLINKVLSSLTGGQRYPSGRTSMFIFPLSQQSVNRAGSQATQALRFLLIRCFSYPPFQSFKHWVFVEGRCWSEIIGLAQSLLEGWPRSAADVCPTHSVFGRVRRVKPAVPPCYEFTPRSKIPHDQFIHCRPRSFFFLEAAQPAPLEAARQARRSRLCAFLRTSDEPGTTTIPVTQPTPL